MPSALQQETSETIIEDPNQTMAKTKFPHIPRKNQKFEQLTKEDLGGQRSRREEDHGKLFLLHEPNPKE